MRLSHCFKYIFRYENEKKIHTDYITYLNRKKNLI